MPPAAATPPARAPQWRALTRAFLGRFFDHDITGGTDDLRLSFIWLLAFLAMPGVVMPILQAWAVSWNGHGVDAGWILTASRSGVDALRVTARADKAFYLGYAAIATAALAAMTWQSLTLDRRDTQVLGPLPVRPSIVVAAKLTALAIYVTAITSVMNLASAVMFGALLASGNSIAFALRGMAAHFVASCGVGVFVVAAIAAAQGVALALAGPRRFARVSALCQAALATAIVLGLFALPLMSGAVNATLAGGPGARPWVLGTPPVWFLGVYEVLLGGRIDPALLHLARIAAAATLGALLLILVSYPLGYRRLARGGAVATGGGSPRRTRRPSSRLAALIGLGTPDIRGVAEFLLATIARSERHRFVLATAAGLAMAWALPTALALSAALPTTPDVALFAMPFATVLFAILGLRMAITLPADLSAGWIFELTTPWPLVVRTAVRRTLTAICVVPVMAITMAIDVWLFGGTFAARHAMVLVATSLVLVETAVASLDTVPCTAEWRPERANLRAWWPVYLAAFALFTRGIPMMGFFASRTLPTAMVFALVLWSIAALIRARAERRFAPRIVEPENPAADVDTRALGERARELLSDIPNWPRHGWQDAPFAFRRLRAAPFFGLFAVATLAIGIGATAATYAFVTSVSTAQVGFADADRVLAITRFTGHYNRPADLSWPDYQDLRQAETAFSEISAWTSLPTSLSANDTSEFVSIEGVSGNGFDTIGVRPAIGRVIGRDDDRVGAPPVAMLSDAVWRTRFGASRSVIGATVKIGGQPFQVIGVVPPTFLGVEQRDLLRTSAWIPLAQAPAMFPAIGFPLDLSNRRHDWLRVIARVRPDATVDAAGLEVRGISHRLDQTAPVVGTTRDEAARRWSANPAAAAISQQGAPLVGWLYLALPSLVFLIACSNLANLVLSRGASRQHDLAVRQALGASRSRLVREQLIDAVTLAVLGGLGGIIVARGLIEATRTLVTRTLGTLPQYQFDLAHSSSILIAAAAAACLTVIIAGLAPALPLTRGAARRAFADAGATSVPRWRGRARVITAHVAISTGLLLFASLFIRQLVADFSHPGREGLSDVGVVVLPLGLQQLDNAGGRRAIEHVLAEAERAPWLSSVAAVTLTDRNFRAPLTIEISSPPKGFAESPRDALFADQVIGSPALFRTLSLPIHFGRGFDDRDAATSEKVAVIGARLARALFGRDDAAGEHLSVRGRVRDSAGRESVTTMRVVGISDDWDLGPSRVAGTLYVPLSQDFASSIAIVGRARAGAGGTAASVLQRAIHDAEPDLATSFAGSADVAANQAARMSAFATSIAGGLASLAVTLAMAGLYGVLTHLVSRRTREVGVRVALGASSRDIIELVMREGLRPVAFGLVFGVTAATLLRMALQPLFQREISAFDGVALAIAVVPLAVVGLLACYLPARRASRVQPTEALRHT